MTTDTRAKPATRRLAALGAAAAVTGGWCPWAA